MFKILFVGEQVNKRVSNIPFNNSKNGSGKFLCDSLTYAFRGRLIIGSILFYKFYFDNVIVNNKINLKLKNRVKGKTVIALGNVADKILTEMKIGHKKLPHPSYFKRFKSKEGYKGYGYLIWRTVNGK